MNLVSKDTAILITAYTGGNDPVYHSCGDNDVSWDNGKNIQQVFEKHFYQGALAELVHAKDLESYLK